MYLYVEDINILVNNVFWRASNLMELLHEEEEEEEEVVSLRVVVLNEVWPSLAQKL